MPQFYKRKDGSKPRKYVPADVMQLACKEVADEINSLRATAKKFDVDRTTLARYVSKFKANPNEAVILKPNFKKKQIYSSNEEILLKDYVIKASKLHHGLSRKEVCSLAYEFAAANNKEIPPSWDQNQSAGFQVL